MPHHEMSAEFRRQLDEVFAKNVFDHVTAPGMTSQVSQYFGGDGVPPSREEIVARLGEDAAAAADELRAACRKYRDATSKGLAQRQQAAAHD